MPANKPTVSFIVCTYSVGGMYSCDHLIKRCLNSIFRLNYPPEKIEVICVDGGSTPQTLKLLKTYPVKIINNKKKLSEGVGMGKSQGVNAASGEFIIIVDQDNELISENWLAEMLAPLINDEKIFGSACQLYVAAKDNITNRYLAYIGGDPFAAPISLDGMLGLGTAKLNDCGSYFTINMSQKDFFITGGNCFLYRKSALEKIGGYTKDIDTVWKIIRTKTNILAVPKTPRTHHAQATSLWKFLMRKSYYAKQHFKNSEMRGEFSWVPRNFSGFARMFAFTASNILILTNIPIAVAKFLQTRDAAWLLHPIASLLATVGYAYVALTSKVLRK